MKSKLKNIIESQDSRSGIIFDIFIQLLILLSLLAYAIETLPNLSKEHIIYLNTFETISIMIFSIEYILRVYVSDRKIGYIFSFYGIVDFLAILPYYLITSIDLRSIRVFRLLRIFRVIKLFRFNRAIDLMSKALAKVRAEITIFLFITLVLIYLSSIVIYHCEHAVQPDKFKSIFHSMWWSVMTLTTVGYGEIYPVTSLGKLFTSFLSIIGIGIVAIPTGLLASSLTSVMDEDKK